MFDLGWVGATSALAATRTAHWQLFQLALSARGSGAMRREWQRRRSQLSCGAAPTRCSLRAAEGRTAAPPCRSHSAGRPTGNRGRPERCVRAAPAPSITARDHDEMERDRARSWRAGARQVAVRGHSEIGRDRRPAPSARARRGSAAVAPRPTGRTRRLSRARSGSAAARRSGEITRRRDRARTEATPRDDAEIWFGEAQRRRRTPTKWPRMPAPGASQPP